MIRPGAAWFNEPGATLRVPDERASMASEVGDLHSFGRLTRRAGDDPNDFIADLHRKPAASAITPLTSFKPAADVSVSIRLAKSREEKACANFTNSNGATAS
jgi:hypothetical protein